MIAVTHIVKNKKTKTKKQLWLWYDNYFCKKNRPTDRLEDRQTDRRTDGQTVADTNKGVVEVQAIRLVRTNM